MDTGNATGQLLLAAKVRELAVALRTNARMRAWGDHVAALSPEQQPTDLQEQQWLNDWRNANRLEDFVIPALERIRGVAQLIQRHPD